MVLAIGNFFPIRCWPKLAAGCEQDREEVRERSLKRVTKAKLEGSSCKLVTYGRCDGMASGAMRSDESKEFGGDQTMGAGWEGAKGFWQRMGREGERVRG